MAQTKPTSSDLSVFVHFHVLDAQRKYFDTLMEREFHDNFSVNESFSTEVNIILYEVDSLRFEKLELLFCI